MTPIRISNAAAGSWIENRYSTITPFSKDNKYLLLVHQDHFELWDGTGGRWLKRLTLSADSEPCWSRQDPHILYYRWLNEVREFDVRTEVSVTLRKFPNYQRIGGEQTGEADISEDGKHLVLCGDGHDIFVYNLAADSVTEAYRWNGYFNSLYLTGDNNVLVSNGGVHVLEAGTLRNLGKIAPTIAHQDVCRDRNGAEILIRFNAADAFPSAIPTCLNGIETVNIRTSNRRCVWSIGWMPQDRGGGPASFAGHISCSDRECYVSLYSPMNVEPSRIYKLPLDGSGSEVLCNTGSVMMKNPDGSMAYNPTPRASVSRDGSRIVFNSNGGVTDRGINYCDVYMLTLGAVIDTPKPEPPKPEPIVVTPTPDLELEALRRDNAILRQRLAAHQSLEQNLAAAQEAARVATAQVTGLRQEVEVSAAYRQDLEQKNTAMEKQIGIFKAALADPHPDPDIWPAIDFLQRGHLPGQRWEFELQETGKLKMFDVIGDERIPIEIPQGNQYLFVQTAAGLEQRERRTNQK